MNTAEIPTLDEINAELARREMLEYLQFTWQTKDTEPLQVGIHTRDICKEIDEAITRFRRGESSFIILTVPPQHGKSEIVSKALPTRFLGLFPDKRVMVASYSSGLSDSLSKDGRKLMRSAEYKAVFPEISLSRENAGVHEWGIERNGEQCKGKAQFSGMDGSMTGKGAHLIVIDDPLKGRAEAESEVIRNKIWDCTRNDIMTRRAPVSIVIVTLTRWHDDDIAGRIIKQMESDPSFPKFKIVSWPAESETYRQGVLFPERYTPEFYKAQKSILGLYAWSALYMCSPTPRHGNALRADKVNIIKVEDWQRYTSGIRFARGWDLASSTEERTSDDPDYTSGCKAGVRMVSTGQSGLSIPLLFIDDYVRGKWEATERNRRIIETAVGDGNIPVGVEAFAGYKDAYTTLRDILKGIRSVSKSNLPGDKLAKSDLVAPIFEAGNVFMKEAPWNAEVLKYYSQFPSGKHDDDIDALVVAFDTLNKRTDWS